MAKMLVTRIIRWGKGAANPSAGGLIRVMHTSSPLHSGEKTEVQKLGWEYLKGQEATHRPLSPHLTIYKPQLTWMVSGFHRVSGCVMAGTLLVGGAGFALLPMDFSTFVQIIDGWHVPWPFLDAFKFTIAYPIFFHVLNGIRFLGFDLAVGTDIHTVYKTGWGVIYLSALLALLVVVASRIRKKSQNNENAQQGMLIQ